MRHLTRAFFLMMVIAAPAAADETPFTALTKVQGDVTVLRGGQSLPGTEGRALETGDVVRTGSDGTADISMNALAGCRVMPGSECGIREQKKKEMHMKLSGGRAIFNLEKLPIDAKFSVETPTAIASVRGTQFSGNVDGPNTTFSVRDDSIEVFRLEGGNPVGDPVTIGAGFSCDVAEGMGGMTTRQATGVELTVMEQTGSVKTCA